MPDDYYVSQYSGEEIDALLASAGAGTVRYDVAQSLTDTQKTQARANIAAAPSGGGVMETVLEVRASSASESYDTFCAKLDAVLATMPDLSVKFLLVYPPQYYGFGTDMCALFKGDNNYASVYTIGSYNNDRQGFRMIKRKRYGSDPAGQWDPLEYINPPMQLGVEYRTTERFLWKPVYVKVVNCGQISDGKEVEHGISNMEYCVSAQGLMSGMALPQFLSHDLSNTWSAYISQVFATKIRFECGTSVVGNNIAVILKYTKTTD